MPFGHQYGPVEDDVEESDTNEEDSDQRVPPDHPASVERCDHGNCDGETPGPRQRICDDCTEIMRPEMPDECGYCGSSISGE